MTPFSEDSFFTLSLIERVGLLGVSLLLSALCILAVRKVSSIRKVKFVIALAVFFLFVWLSPQIYYLYYIAIFGGLPWQIVIRSIPTIPTLSSLIFFVSADSLAKLSQGVLFWLLMVAVFAPNRSRA